MPVSYGLIGRGWRADFYLRLAEALPARFHVSGLVTRSAAAGAALTRRWGVPTYRGVEHMLDADRPEFVVTSVPPAANPEVVQELLTLGAPVLSETPPAPDVEGLAALWEASRGGVVEVAEQHPFLPGHAARLSVIRSGLLGTVSSAQLSSTHGYHAVCLLRRLLGVGFGGATIHARAHSAPLLTPPGREGWPDTDVRIEARTVLATLDFGDRLGVYDFTDGQWFSPIRTRRVVVRGDRGEIVNNEIVSMLDARTPVHSTLRRQQTGVDGDLDGAFLRAILLDGAPVWRNPYAPARLSDEEIAIAGCLDGMARRVREGGPGGYSLADACQDQYLSLLLAAAAESGEPVRAVPQPWAG